MKNIFNIKTVLLFAIVFAAASCTKVKTDDDFTKGDPPPVAGGFTNSSQVAETNLLAYWNFDGSNNEIKSSTIPLSAINASFVDGIKGKALNLNSGYVLYPTISALSDANAIKSCTVSLWVKFKNNGSQASEFFSLSKATTAQTDWLGILNVAAETGRDPANNNLVFHSWVGTYPAGNRNGGDNINDYGIEGVDFKTVPKANEWVQYIMRYNGVAETVDLFANNILVSNKNFRVRTGLGPIVCPTPTQVLLGGFPTAATGFNLSGTQGWQALLTGSIDELRVYSKALTDVEISALFQLERQGR
jgi:hypothetical protein